MAVTGKLDPVKACEACGVEVTFVKHVRSERPVCLEVDPWSPQPGEEHPALFLIQESHAVPFRNKYPAGGGDLYACHTTRPDHGHLRRDA